MLALKRQAECFGGDTRRRLQKFIYARRALGACVLESRFVRLRVRQTSINSNKIDLNRIVSICNNSHTLKSPFNNLCTTAQTIYFLCYLHSTHWKMFLLLLAKQPSLQLFTLNANLVVFFISNECIYAWKTGSCFK